MNVVPKVWHTGEMRWIAWTEGVGVICQVEHPPSSAGRTVHVFFTDDECEQLLRELRQRAIYRRRQTMTEADA